MFQFEQLLLERKDRASRLYKSERNGELFKSKYMLIMSYYVMVILCFKIQTSPKNIKLRWIFKLNRTFYLSKFELIQTFTNLTKHLVTLNWTY